MKLRWAVGAIVVVFVPFAACGGKTTTVGAEDGGDAAPSPTASSTPEASVPFDAGGRICPECTIGHQCCMGGCGGLPVPLPSDCCSCLADEVDSMTCSNGMCGN